MNVMGPKFSMVGGFAAIGLSQGNESWIPTIDLYTQYLDEDERRDYMVVYPIPQREMDLNDNLIQNFGY